MKLEVYREKSIVIRLDEPGWVTGISKISKAEKDFWCAAGEWIGYEIWDKELKDWKIKVDRRPVK